MKNKFWKWVVGILVAFFLLVIISLLIPTDPDYVPKSERPTETKIPTVTQTLKPTVPSPTPLPPGDFIIRDFLAGVYAEPNYHLDEITLLGKGDPVYIPGGLEELYCEQPNIGGVIFNDSPAMQMCYV